MIEPGKLVDLLVVDGDPLADIKILQNHDKIALVMKDESICVGRVYSRTA